MTSARMAVAQLASLSRTPEGDGGQPRASHEPSHWACHRLWLPGVEITNGRTKWGALGLGRTSDEAAERLHAELTNLPEGQWVEVVQFDRERIGPGRSDWPVRRAAWDGERWDYVEEDGDA